ncbi:MAG: large-conductance mechanosensitive channel protein MscL [bacterium]|nr:large-conductance mechanosensitive channel protein MscL [bacterium]
MGMIKDFKTFISRGNVVDLAVGVIIAAAFGAIVSSLVADIITPPIGYLLNNVKFEEIVTVLKEADATGKGGVTVNWGKFILTVVNFVIVAFCVFMVIRLLSRVSRKQPPAAPAPPTREEELLMEIRDLLKRSPQL